MKNLYKISTAYWYIERLTYLIAGIIILVSVLCALLFNINWLILTALVGFMLISFALTGYCPMAMLLKMIGIKEK